MVFMLLFLYSLVGVGVDDVWDNDVGGNDLGVTLRMAMATQKPRR